MIININLEKTNIGNAVDEITKKLTDEEAYNLATYLLSKLESKGYCIWQTYSKEDVKMLSGKEDLVKEDMEEYQCRLEDCANDGIFYN